MFDPQRVRSHDGRFYTHKGQVIRPKKGFNNGRVIDPLLLELYTDYLLHNQIVKLYNDWNKNQIIKIFGYSPYEFEHGEAHQPVLVQPGKSLRYWLIKPEEGRIFIGFYNNYSQVAENITFNQEFYFFRAHGYLTYGFIEFVDENNPYETNHKIEMQYIGDNTGFPRRQIGLPTSEFEI